MIEEARNSTIQSENKELPRQKKRKNFGARKTSRWWKNTGLLALRLEKSPSPGRTEEKKSLPPDGEKKESDIPNVAQVTRQYLPENGRFPQEGGRRRQSIPRGVQDH